METVLFLCENLIIGDDFMFSDEILEKIFSHEEMQKIPIGTQATAVHVFEEIIEDILEENPYEQLSNLLISTATDESISAEF